MKQNEGEAEVVVDGEAAPGGEAGFDGEAGLDGEAAIEGAGEGTPFRAHSADYIDGDGVISLTEVLRVVQYFNIGGYGCGDSKMDTKRAVCCKAVAIRRTSISCRQTGSWTCPSCCG